MEVFVIRGGSSDEDIARRILNGALISLRTESVADRRTAFLTGRELPKADTIGHPDAFELLASLDDDATIARVPDTAESADLLPVFRS